MKLTIQHQAEMRALAGRFGVQELALFGSVVSTAGLGPASDVDVLVRFQDGPAFGRFAAYMGLKEALEAMFKRPVDLISAAAIRNPVFRQQVEAERQVVYVAPA